MVPEMHPVESSAIETIGYDPEASTLAITFTGGATYFYLGVPPHLYDQLMTAESKGSFVNKVIKPTFPSVAQET